MQKLQRNHKQGKSEQKISWRS